MIAPELGAAIAVVLAVTTPAPPEPDRDPPAAPWTALAACESGGNWRINTGNGFYGGLQFSVTSWRGVGGRGLPSEASRAEQIRRAVRLLALQGWAAWPACSARLGLR